jgi:hypothetical protein
LQTDLAALTDASESFRASVAAGNPQSRLVRDFATLEEVWARVAPGVMALSQGERLLLSPRAARVDGVVIRLHRRLGLAGAPARFDLGAEQPQAINGLGLPMR